MSYEKQWRPCVLIIIKDNNSLLSSGPEPELSENTRSLIAHAFDGFKKIYYDDYKDIIDKWNAIANPTKALLVNDSIDIISIFRYSIRKGVPAYIQKDEKNEYSCCVVGPLEGIRLKNMKKNLKIYEKQCKNNI